VGKRLSRIVTRTGDDGKTGLADGSRVAKHSLRMETIGTVDELNSTIGVFLAELGSEGDVGRTFLAIQNDLFDIGGELSMPGHVIVPEDAWQGLETAIERLNDDLEPLANFILPGGSRAVAMCHVVRAVARRAERCYVALCDEQVHAEGEDLVNDNARIYLNRLSDLCFVAARWLAKARGEPEILWQQNTRK
jgi:cob(I)alamin adenosyltransferase